MPGLRGIGAILSGMPLPRLPPIDQDGKIDGLEQDKYNKDVREYLRRLMGQFNDINLTSGDIFNTFGAIIYERCIPAQVIDNTSGSVRVNIYRVVVPANTLVAGTGLICEVWGEPGAGDLGAAIRVHLAYGGNTFAQTAVNSGITTRWNLTGFLAFRGVSSQRGYLYLQKRATTAIILTEAAIGTDSTVDQNFDFDITVQSSAQLTHYDFFHLRLGSIQTPAAS